MTQLISSIYKNNFIAISLYFAAQLAPGCAWAFNNPSLQWHGFITQSALSTTANNFFGKTEKAISTDFRELGLNGKARFMENFNLSSQILYRQAGNTDSNKLQMDFLSLDYRLAVNQRFSGGALAGRSKIPLGLYNETRDVAHTRPGILLPQSIYFDRTRDLALSADGLQIYGLYSGHVPVSARFGVALPRLSTNTEYALFGFDAPGTMKAKPSYALQLNSDLYDDQLHLAYSSAILNMSHEPTSISGWPGTDIQFQAHVLSAQWNSERWIFSSEYARRIFNFHQSPLFPNNILTGESYYIQLQYILSKSVQTILRFDHGFLNIKDRKGLDYQFKTTNPAYSQYARDYSLGVRWNLARHWLLMTEMHFIRGTMWLAPQENKTQKENWALYTLLLSYYF